MSRTTINTGEVIFNESKQDGKNQTPTAADTPLHIVILSDLSARASRGIIEPDAIKKRPVYSVDRDNFEDFFEELGVKLKVPLSDEVISFSEFDDLHPDYLYDRIPLFSEFRKLERQLKKKDKFNEAASKIRQWGNYKHEATEASAIDTPDSTTPLDAGLLDNILTQSTPPESYDANALIQEIIAPFVEPKDDPELKPMLQAVEDASSDLMRKLMHSSAFQTLEASWRSLYLLVRRLETNRNLKIQVLDISKAEILADLEQSENIESSNTYDKLCTQTQVAGAIPAGIILGDFELQDSVEDCRLALALAKIASTNGSTAICAGHSKLAGCESLASSEGTEDWQYKIDDTVQAAWESLREQSEAAHLMLTSPRFMLRLPYGKKTSVTESFAYEELPSHTAAHDYYLWGNSAFLSSLLLAESYQHKGWQLTPGEHHIVEGLPIHAVSQGFDDYVKPCAEILLTDSMTNALNEAGLTAVRAFKDRDAVTIAPQKAIAKGAKLRGLWSK